MDILLVLAPYLVPFAGALAVGLGKFLFERMPTRQREEAARIVQVAVTAAEQSMPDAAGPDKKAAVEADLAQVFKASHLNVPPTLLNMFIESAVSAMNEGKAPPVSTSQVGFTPPTTITPAPAGV